MPHGSVLRIEPVAQRDDSRLECMADNGIGEPATAVALLTVYPEADGKCAGHQIWPTQALVGMLGLYACLWLVT